LGQKLLLTGDERAVHAEAIASQSALAQQQAESIANQERLQKEKLEAYLRSIGINPNNLLQ
jgi:hypothetical protein